MSDRWPSDTRRRETLIRLPIGELAAWHLMVTCPACPPMHQERPVLVVNLIARYGANQTLVMLVQRLRCGEPSCRRPPSRIRLRSKFQSQPGPEIVEVELKDRPRA